MRFSYFLLCLFCSSCFSGSNFPENAMIEINSIPPPFDINGRRAYVVWVNGKRVDLNQKEIVYFVNKIGAENIKPVSAEDIHLGWLMPYYGNESEENRKQSRVK